MPEAIMPATIAAVEPQCLLASYALNVKVQLLKKKSATQRQHPISITQTKGGLRLFCQPLIYELFRQIVLAPAFANELEAKLGSNFQVRDTQTRDINGAVAQHSVTIKRGVTQLHTINMYNTTSSMLINGKHEDVFLKQIAPVVLKVIQMHPDTKSDKSLQEKNRSLASIIDKAIWDLTHNKLTKDWDKECVACELTGKKTKLTCDVCEGGK